MNQYLIWYLIGGFFNISFMSIVFLLNRKEFYKSLDKASSEIYIPKRYVVVIAYFSVFLFSWASSINMIKLAFNYIKECVDIEIGSDPNESEKFLLPTISLVNFNHPEHKGEYGNGFMIIFSFWHYFLKIDFEF